MEFRAGVFSFGLLFPQKYRQKRSSVHAGGLFYACCFENCWHEVDARYEMIVVDGIGFYFLGPAYDPRSFGAVEVAVGLGKRKRHAIITEEHYEGAGFQS